jgi:ATP/maltotriose-dependent transcriptional regulator MalT
VAILTSSDGNTSNAVVASTVLSNLTARNTYQDLTIASPYSTTTTVTGNQTQALYVLVNTAVANATVDIRVYGDTVSF